MMNVIRSILILTALLMTCSTSLAKDCRLTAKQIDIYLSRIENALPVLEKQVETITSLLESEQGLEDIRQEMKRLREYTDLPGDRTPLYGELNLHKANDDFFLRGKEFIPFYSLEILHDLTNGGCYGTTSYDKALRDTSPEQWARIAGIMDKLLGILTPLNDVVTRQLGREDTQIVQGWRCDLPGKEQVPFASCLYSSLFAVTESTAQSHSPLRYYSNIRDTRRVVRIMEKAETPLVHLEMMRKYFEYLARRQGDAKWESPIAAIDQMTHDLKTGDDTLADSNRNNAIPVIEFVGF